MKRFSIALISLIFMLGVFNLTGGAAMPAKFTETVFLPDVEKELRGLYGKSIVVGPAAAENSELAVYAAANEFGATVRPKKGKYLALPLVPEAKDRSPKDFDLTFIPPKQTGGNPILARVVKGKSGKDQVIPFYVLMKKVEIPERSWLRSAFDKSETIDKAVRIAETVLNNLLMGQAKASNVHNAIGLSFVASVKARIASNIGPQNRPLTLSLKRKRGSTLVDEGRLIGSIQHEVKNA